MPLTPTSRSHGTNLAQGQSMTRNFVAINDRTHNLLRNLARRSLLRPCLGVDGALMMQYSVDAISLPDDYFSLAMLHGIGGMSLDLLKKTAIHLRPDEKQEIPEQVNCFDALTLDRRCS